MHPKDFAKCTLFVQSPMLSIETLKVIVKKPLEHTECEVSATVIPKNRMSDFLQMQKIRKVTPAIIFANQEV